MDPKFAFALKTLGLLPKTYDEHGWWTLSRTHGLDDLIDPADTELPKNAKDIEGLCKKFLVSVSRSRDEILQSLNADEFVKITDDAKRKKMFDSWIETNQMLCFPAYIFELPPAAVKTLCERFMFTTAQDGSVIAYYRPSMEVNVWKECPDSEKPFTRTYGLVRDIVEHLTMLNYLTKNVKVYIDDRVIGPFPYYKLFIKYKDRFLENITGTDDNRQVVIDEFNEFVESMRKASNGHYSKLQLQNGLQKLDENLEDLDKKFPMMKFLYRPEIKLTSLTNNRDEESFAYFDLDSSISPGDTPDFDGFMESIHPACRDSLMAAIYANFDARVHLNQYIWIHGEGGDGKSSLLGAIAEYAGDDLVCSLGQTLNSEFGLENAVGKRMVILSDVKTGLSVKSQLIHNLTGHDLISVNRKNKPIITTRLDPILWIAANAAPDVNFDNRNEARRCLYIKMVDPPVAVKRKFYFMDENGNFVLDAGGNPINNGYDLKGGLVREMPHILYKCREAFERVCHAPYSVIRQSYEQSELALENCIDLDANEWATFIDETFDFSNKQSIMSITEIVERLQSTRERHGEKNALNNFERRDILRLLSVKYGCEKKKKKGVRYLQGIDCKAIKPLNDFQKQLIDVAEKHGLTARRAML